MHCAQPFLLGLVACLSLFSGCLGTTPETGADCINYSYYGPFLGADTTKLAGFQDDALRCIAQNGAFGREKAAYMLDTFILGYNTGIPAFDNADPLLHNNLAIRSLAVRMLLANGTEKGSTSGLAKLRQLASGCGFESNGYASWCEGSGYLAYTLNAIRMLNSRHGDIWLESFQAKSGRWLNDFSLPNGELAPIYDTALGSPSYGPRTPPDGITYTDHETAVFFGNGTGYLLVRHPLYMAEPGTAIRNNLHTSLDIGSISLWHNGSWIIRPTGYPGYSEKVSERLGTEYGRNVQYAERIGNDFEQWDLNSGNIPAYFTSWRFATVANFSDDYITRHEYPDRYEIVLEYRLNTGPNSSFEEYSRTVIVPKNNSGISVSDYCSGGSSSSYLLVSENASVFSDDASISCDNSGKWSPAWGKVEPSRRCRIYGNGAVSYSVGWQ